MKKIIFTTIFLLGFFAPIGASAQVACTADAKLCPDGSYVGRTGPSCQFAACPGASTSTTLCPNISNNLALGKRGEEVKELQKFLFNYYGVSNLATTGYFGVSTKGYLTRFQKDHKIINTGNLGKLTREKILATCTGGQACTKIYKPVCATLKTNCGCSNGVCTMCVQPVDMTYSNECEMKNAGATFVREGRCEDVVSNTPPESCKIWYDGCNTCSRQSPGGPMACTLMACVMGGDSNYFAQNKPTCREYFNSSSVNPTISSFSGPVVLNSGEKGIWSVVASIPNNEQLTYNIIWGDEKNYLTPMTGLVALDRVYSQSSTFEHTYSVPGTYTVSVEVRSKNGGLTKTTTTVVVKGTGARCYDAGTSYEEGKSKGCLTNSDGTIACIADAAYFCRNGVWKIEGTYWWK